MKTRIIQFHPLLIFFLILLNQPTYGQYFGKNKVQYEDLNFKIYQTPHFDIYHYTDDSTTIKELGRLSERWYTRHQAVMADTFKQRNPMIIYSNHPDFKQTTLLNRQISVGLGGVTEGLRNRVTMPVTVSNQETSHVLGHEMVHAFQYHLAKTSDSIGLRGLSNIPLWFIEGAAEYLSIGPRSTHTAIWMRDAIIHNDIPTFEDMSKEPNEYFPYRYGHAAWSYLTGVWGDGIIRPMHMLAAKSNYKDALDTLTGYKPDSIATLWSKTLKNFYLPLMQDTIGTIGERFLDEDARGEINISPVLSQDGKYLAFITDRNVISIDIYMANARTGKRINKLSEAVKASHIDDYSYLESAGSWSPDGSEFVLTTFIEGRNQLLIVKANNLNNTTNLSIPGVEAFRNPTWSPDGNSIVVSGLNNGQSDLYQYHLNSGEVTQLTNDDYSDLQPEFSPDGSMLVFITDRGENTDINNFIYGEYRLATYNFNSGEVNVLNIFPGANNVNPKFSYDGSKIFFLSNADGFRNLYEFNRNNGDLNKLTRYSTGIIGITEYTPVLDVAGEEDMIVYTLYQDKNYRFFKAPAADFPRFAVNGNETDFTASILPPRDRNPVDIVAENLDETPIESTESYDLEPYDPRFKLEFIGNSGVGVGTSQFGTNYAGGVSLLFSDILKRNQLYTMLRINGQIEDIGGQVNYLNRGNRFNWGVAFSHIPYRSSLFGFSVDTLQQDGEEIVAQNLIRQVQRVFEDQLTFYGQYPLSANLRFEAGASMAMYNYSIDSINNFYSRNGIKFEESEYELDAPATNYIGNTYAAFVGDNSTMGITSPLMGNRYRIEVEKKYFDLNIWSFLGDYRKYWFAKPLSFAIRGLFFGRYGEDNDILYPLFVGNNYFVRGYTINSFRKRQCPDGDCLSENQLIGSKMAVTNAEVRLPFTGPERLSIIKSGFLFSDLVLFFDGGVAWNDPDNLEFEWNADSQGRSPVFSTGIALRINLFGYVVLEPYLAFPLQRENATTVFNLFLSAGGW